MSSERIEDPENIEWMVACKKARFPICLDRALTRMFSGAEPIISLAMKAGFRLPKNITSRQDIVEIYLNFFSHLAKEIEPDAVSVIEHECLKELESMNCTECPIYKLEIERKSAGYASRLPSVCEYTKSRK